jgi:two-component system chemotaxis response regulator CheY
MAKLVLIVEDSETCAETLQIALESIPGLEARVSHNPRAAIEVLRQNSDIVAIVTDLNLPQYSGLDLIRELRAEPRFARIPILLISGDSDPRLPAKALAHGADAFFPKPYSPSAVRRKLEQLIC